jgi:hypothetical protein
MSLESDGGMIFTGQNRRTRRKTCPSATLSTTNPTWIDLGTNPGLRGDRPVTDDLSHGTAPMIVLPYRVLVYADDRMLCRRLFVYFYYSREMWVSPSETVTIELFMASHVMPCAVGDRNVIDPLKAKDRPTTKKLTKVLRKHKTSSLASLNHSCVRNA